MKIVKLPKKNLVNFINRLKIIGEIYAPVKKSEQSFVFTNIDTPEEIELNYIRTILPLKKFFLKPVDTMFHFYAERGYEIPVFETDKKYIIFGVHSCEIHGLKILDLVLGGKYADASYFSRRNNAVIIGLDCIPDEHCFCQSTATDFIDSGFDLFLSDIDDCYLVRVGTSLGDDMIRLADSLFRKIENEDHEKYKIKSRQRRESFSTELKLQDLPEIMDLEYESQVWRELGEKCLSCGICSVVCPTCYCYSIFDELDLNVQSGKRQRRWDSCLFKDYSMVAGGHNFRAERSSRVKNRYFHKQRGFVAQHGRPSCVGCGRCRISCPAGVDIIEVVNKLRSESYA